jgi:hypothetical protein
MDAQKPFWAFVLLGQTKGTSEIASSLPYPVPCVKVISLANSLLGTEIISP